jgi:hypothetical protein
MIATNTMEDMVAETAIFMYVIAKIECKVEVVGVVYCV